MRWPLLDRYVFRTWLRLFPLLTILGFPVADLIDLTTHLKSCSIAEFPWSGIAPGYLYLLPEKRSRSSRRRS